MKCDKCGCEYDPYAELKAAQKAGKVVQRINKNWGCPSRWTDCIDDSTFGVSEYAHRIKPEPCYRPWKPEEVPVGALIRRKHRPEFICVILGATTDKHADYAILNAPLRPGSNHYLSDLLTYHGGNNGDANEHSLDHGKTWLPCGVLIDE